MKLSIPSATYCPTDASVKMTASLLRADRNWATRNVVARTVAMVATPALATFQASYNAVCVVAKLPFAATIITVGKLLGVEHKFSPELRMGAVFNHARMVYNCAIAALLVAPVGLYSPRKAEKMLYECGVTSHRFRVPVAPVPPQKMEESVKPAPKPDVRQGDFKFDSPPEASLSERPASAPAGSVHWEEFESLSPEAYAMLMDYFRYEPANGEQEVSPEAIDRYEGNSEDVMMAPRPSAEDDSAYSSTPSYDLDLIFGSANSSSEEEMAFEEDACPMDTPKNTIQREVPQECETEQHLQEAAEELPVFECVVEEEATPAAVRVEVPDAYDGLIVSSDEENGDEEDIGIEDLSSRTPFFANPLASSMSFARGLFASYKSNPVL